MEGARQEATAPRPDGDILRESASVFVGHGGLRQRSPLGAEAAGKKIHHQQAIEMARAEIAHGKSSELKAMARKIIQDQQKEIAQFDRWMASRK